MTPDPQSLYPTLYRSLYRIRRFEKTVLENFPKGVFFGTTHTYLGQEANAVGVLFHLQPGDVVFSNHRCHGHFLAYGGDMRTLFAELMGKPGGVVGGRGGSQHIHWGNFFSNGIQGSSVPVATGAALAEKLKEERTVTLSFIGDGTLGEGVIYESFNMAALWGAPVLYVLENNRIAQTTPIELAVAGDICARFAAFGIPAQELDSSDVRQVTALAGELIADVRESQTPRALVLHTYRFGPHSKGDDTRTEKQLWQIKAEHDPLTIQAERLEAGQRKHTEQQVDEAVQTAFEQAKEEPVYTRGED
jgi:TPP-dependent pyruvate/acetoin dehydrogenase alpha subunit